MAKRRLRFSLYVFQDLIVEAAAARTTIKKSQRASTWSVKNQHSQKQSAA
jgi:hypothetical protein